MSEINTLSNAIVWVDLPVHDLARARAFYQTVLDTTLDVQSNEGLDFAVFMHAGGNGGCLVPTDAPIVDSGMLVYFNV